MAIYLSDAKIQAVEKILQYEFQGKRLLEQALEAAGSTNRPEGNKRLAQLGDATLQLSIKLAGFEARQSIGSITISLSKKASNENLTAIGFSLGLDKFIILNPSSQGVVQPRLMATTVEALIGAVYLDNEKSIQAPLSVIRALGILQAE
ncbi:uncharacterized protein N7483_002119 [Penicillium malachiteum]|uniref:uncharacterized protein n=1 Tax=Penicillium malachiteum TaxID=1324776 RepID=UPI002548D4C7|nr:uncharacterized protein N7483_002119 [Penicillium malachiteum]KAJ5736994.1 hypothetical protein N7483_002119 [Penicillium malachiteum]